MSMIKLKNVSKFYYSKGVIASGFTKINLEFKMGEFVAITGESGSGKSTLLNVISGLDTYEEGEMYINGEETSHYTEKDFEDYRRKYIGNIFQNFNLVNSYTVFQNIELVLLLNGAKKKDVKERVIELIRKVDLYKFRNTKVSKLSGGQKQRVAIARALAKDTPIIIADEPTGNLDSRSAASIIKLLSEIAKDKLVIIVTHNYEQVEGYVTRKIKMHDGKVLEDKHIKKIEEIDNDYEQVYKNITFFNKIRLGLRNTFNIIPKFLLMLFVYFFITIALVGTYTSFKQDEYNESIQGANYYFHSTTNDRIIVKKKDKSPFTSDEQEKIEKLDNVKEIYKNDALLDSSVEFSDGEYNWFYGSVRDIKELDKVAKGRMPENPNEIVLIGNPDRYSQVGEELLEKTIYFENLSSYELEKDRPLTIVGVENRDDILSDYVFYVSEELLNRIRMQVNIRFSTVEMTFLNKIYTSDYYNIVPTPRVPAGQAYISETFRYYCKDFWCGNDPLNIKVSNLYYETDMTVYPTNYFKKENMNALLGINYDDGYYDNTIYVNDTNYYSLFNKDTYQISVIIDEEKKLDDTLSELEKMDLVTLNMRDARVRPDIIAAMNIIKTGVITFVVIALFFICYFVIKLILKSRNVYFATIRMLGASKNVSVQLIVVELYTIANLAYLLLLGLVKLNSMDFVNIEMLTKMLKYLTISDYVILYLILVVMSILVSVKFSKKLFKNSAMKSLREEV